MKPRSSWLSCPNVSKFSWPWLLWFIIHRLSTNLQVIVTCFFYKHCDQQSFLLNWIFFRLVSENIKLSLPESLKRKLLFLTFSKLPSRFKENTIPNTRIIQVSSTMLSRISFPWISGDTCTCSRRVRKEEGTFLRFHKDFRNTESTKVNYVKINNMKRIQML